MVGLELITIIGQERQKKFIVKRGNSMDAIQRILEMCKYIEWTNVESLDEYMFKEKRKEDD